MNKRYMMDSDASRLALIVNTKQSLRDAQRARTWEEKVAAIARMNSASRISKTVFRFVNPK
jgi:hypothetical protein